MMKNWQILVAVGVLCIAVINAAPRFGRRHGPPGPPPEFKKYLPKDVVQKIQDIHDDHSLKWEEKKKMINDVLDSVDPEIIKKIPPPPGFEKIPEDVKEKIKSIHEDSSLKWSEKMMKIREIIDKLPFDQRPAPPFPHMPLFPHGPRHMRFRGFPPMPPPGFENVLPKEIYEQLVDVHKNKDLSDSEKKSKIDEIMSKVSKDILQKLPLPPGFDRLPEDVQQKARMILNDFSKTFDDRHKALFEFIKTLPEEQRKLLRPPPPFGGFGPFGPKPWRHGRHFPPKEFKDILPENVFNKLESLNQNKSLSWCDRKKEIDNILKNVDKETLFKLPLPPHLRQLPENIQQQIKEILYNFDIPHRERRQQVRELIDKLPEDLKKLVPPPPFGIFGPRGRGFPMFPPPDFKEHLPTEAWEKLNAIHANRGLSRQERMKQIDEVMNSLPEEVLMKLPLPPHLRKLPSESQEKLHKIFSDKTKSFEEKRKAEKEYIRTLPLEQRRLVRPLPQGFESFPENIKTQIDSIFDNVDLGFHERFEKLHEIMESLPEELKNKIPRPPPFVGEVDHE